MESLLHKLAKGIGTMKSVLICRPDEGHVSLRYLILPHMAASPR